MSLSAAVPDGSTTEFISRRDFRVQDEGDDAGDMLQMAKEGASVYENGSAHESLNMARVWTGNR